MTVSVHKTKQLVPNHLRLQCFLRISAVFMWQDAAQTPYSSGLPISRSEVQPYLHFVENIFKVLNLSLSWMVRRVLFQHLTFTENIKFSQKKAQTLRPLVPVESAL